MQRGHRKVIEMSRSRWCLWRRIVPSTNPTSRAHHARSSIKMLPHREPSAAGLCAVRTAGHDADCRLLNSASATMKTAVWDLFGGKKRRTVCATCWCAHLVNAQRILHGALGGRRLIRPRGCFF